MEIHELVDRAFKRDLSDASALRRGCFARVQSVL